MSSPQLCGLMRKCKSVENKAIKRFVMCGTGSASLEEKRPIHHGHGPVRIDARKIALAKEIGEFIETEIVLRKEREEEEEAKNNVVDVVILSVCPLPFGLCELRITCELFAQIVEWSVINCPDWRENKKKVNIGQFIFFVAIDETRRSFFIFRLSENSSLFH